VIGLFEEWSGTTQDIGLTNRDTLVMFTDGVVEAFNAQDVEFGEERVLDIVREQTGVSARKLVDALVHAGSAPQRPCTIRRLHGGGGPWPRAQHRKFSVNSTLSSRLSIYQTSGTSLYRTR
jgi:Stage II sporulation protein E (SpoIIE)